MTTASPRPPIDARTQQTRQRPSAAAAVQLDPIRVLRQHAVGTGVAAVVGAVLGLAAYFAFAFAYPLYSSQVMFELPAPPNEVGDVIQRDQRTEEAVERVGQTEASRIRARGLLVQAMNLPDILQTEWSKGYLDSSGAFDAEEAVDDLEDELGASHMRRTNFFAIFWSTHVASDVPVVLNAIADTYIAARKVEDDARFANNRKSFADQLKKIDDDIEEISKRLSEFVIDKNMTSTSEERNELLLRVEDTARQINQTRTQLTLAQSRKQQTEQKIKGVIEFTPEDIRLAEDDEQVRQANLRLQELSVELETYSKKFSKDHAAYRSMLARLNAAQIERDVKRNEIIKRNLNADFKEFSDIVLSQSAVLDEFEKKLESYSVALKDYTSHLTTVQQMKDQRERLQEARAKQLEVLANLDQFKAREDSRAAAIARRAQTPRELSFPLLKVMIPLGLLLGVAGFLGFVFVREILDTRVRSAADLASVQGLRLFGSVPDLLDDPVAPAKPERAVRNAPKSVIAESCRQIAGVISKVCAQDGLKTIGFMSGLPEAGTTTFISNAADSLAAGGRKVLVVDANFRRSHLAAAMGTEPDAKGLGDVLHGNIAFADAIRPTGGDVDILPAGTIESRIFELLSGPKFDAMLAEAVQRYDFVLVDLPPAIVAGDAFAVANKVDATVLVVRAMQEQRGLVARLVNQLSDVRGKCIGVVLNRPKNTAGGYLRKNYEVMATYSAKS
jgi:polysaccharide biosynthesis transport protein